MLRNDLFLKVSVVYELPCKVGNQSVTLALSSLRPQEATRSHKKLLPLFRAFAFRYIRSDELFIQQPLLPNEGRLVVSCSVNKYIPRGTYPFCKVSDLTQQAQALHRGT